MQSTGSSGGDHPLNRVTDRLSCPRLVSARGRDQGGVVVAMIVLAAALTSALAGAGDPSASTPTDGARTGRPNVVVILTDDMRADDLRYLPKTRRLLVDRGVRFSNAISPHPMCCPARAELVTGQYGQNNGVRHNTGRVGRRQAAAQPRRQRRQVAAGGGLPDVVPRQVPQRLRAAAPAAASRTAGPSGTPRWAASTPTGGPASSTATGSAASTSRTR